MKPWCIVVADDHGPEIAPPIAGAGASSPVQYCGFGEPATLLQRALHRARRIAPAEHIVVTVREENRELWESALWHIRPEHRFVSNSRMMVPLTTAAALLSIAEDSVTNVVTILPARCYVANERTLCAALNQLQQLLPRIPEGIGTLGMVDIEDGIDEDYLVPFGTTVGPGQAVQAMAHRPTEWVARHLKVAVNGERRFYADVYREMSMSILRSLRWWPPTFPQRALRVHRCGFRGLQTPRAVAKVNGSSPATFWLRNERRLTHVL